MSELDFPIWEQENFVAAAVHEQRAITLTLRGSAEMAVVDGLGPLLMRIHAQALALKVERVRVNLEQLQFMNSSCFKWFVSWLAQLQDLPDPKPYTVQFVSNPRFRWQRASLRALGCLAPDVVVAEEDRAQSAV